MSAAQNTAGCMSEAAAATCRALFRRTAAAGSSATPRPAGSTCATVPAIGPATKQVPQHRWRRVPRRPKQRRSTARRAPTKEQQCSESAPGRRPQWETVSRVRCNNPAGPADGRLASGVQHKRLMQLHAWTCSWDAQACCATSEQHQHSKLAGNLAWPRMPPQRTRGSGMYRFQVRWRTQSASW